MTLRPIEPEDLTLLYTIENDPDLWNSSSASGPYSRYELKQYVAQAQTAPLGNEARFVVQVDSTDGSESVRAIGLADLTNYSSLHARAEVGLALLKEERGLGFGKQAMQLLEQYAVDRLRIHLLYAFVLSQNIPACKLFESVGYKIQTKLPDWHFCHGQYHEVTLFVKYFHTLGINSKRVHK